MNGKVRFPPIAVISANACFRPIVDIGGQRHHLRMTHEDEVRWQERLKKVAKQKPRDEERELD